jgi:dienelactone hydrolase
MTVAGVDWQMIVYGGARRGFTNKAIDPAKSPGSAYHRSADERSWRAMRDLLDETFVLMVAREQN